MKTIEECTSELRSTLCRLQSSANEAEVDLALLKFHQTINEVEKYAFELARNASLANIERLIDGIKNEKTEKAEKFSHSCHDNSLQWRSLEGPPAPQGEREEKQD